MKPPEPPTKLLVCAECRDGLLELGADPLRSPRVGSLLDRCAVHTPASAEVHAMHEVFAVPEAVEKWKRACKLPPAGPVDPRTVDLVARMAAQLLTGMPVAERVEIEQAVYTARAILAFAKGSEP